MPGNERSVSEVFQDIIRNIQEIIRSEVRLAKTEIRDEAVKTKAAGLLIAVGTITGVFAFFFLLLTSVYALSRVMPNWAAALIVSIALAITAAARLSAGLNRFKRIHPAPQRTIETMKENVEWVKQQSK